MTHSIEPLQLGEYSTHYVHTAQGSVVPHAIAQVAATRLGESAYLPLRKLSCDYHEGVLTLRGQVSTFYLKQMAQSLVRNLDGVEEVNNQIEVNFPGGHPRGQIVQRAARGDLRRQPR